MCTCINISYVPKVFTEFEVLEGAPVSLNLEIVGQLNGRNLWFSEHEGVQHRLYWLPIFSSSSGFTSVDQANYGNWRYERYVNDNWEMIGDYGVINGYTSQKVMHVDDTICPLYVVQNDFPYAGLTVWGFDYLEVSYKITYEIVLGSHKWKIRKVSDNSLQATIQYVITALPTGYYQEEPGIDIDFQFCYYANSNPCVLPTVEGYEWYIDDSYFVSMEVSECAQTLPLPPHTNILASGVSNVEHIAAFDAMVEQRFANLDIEAVLIYLIDTVDVDALPSLAAQFDVLGYKGYGLAQTEQQKRDVIKRAIELHRYKGTPWSIKEALKAIGYYNAIIEERLVNPIYYNGIFNHNGSQFYGPGHWADFRVKIDIGNDMGVTPQTASDAVKLILEYKNVRSRLRDVTYMSNLTEYVTDITEELIVNVEVALSDALGYYHNNVYIYGGEITHGTTTETLTT